MEPLNTWYAASLASDVYLVKSNVTRGDFVDIYEGDMELNAEANPHQFGAKKGPAFVTGRTGGVIVQKPHVMAVMANGKGIYNGSAFVVVKGTAGLYDVLTDLNTGIKTCHNGTAVHQGFYYAFESLKNSLEQMKGAWAGKTVHCVGHSLGGAIATLAADWLKSSGVSDVKLYTFGSPRVGQLMFAQCCSSRLMPQNIYRVYHRTDPVPMVPTWPFYHVPNYGGDYLIDSKLSVIPWKFHKMEHYIDSVKDKSWKDIRHNRPAGHIEKAVEMWLQSETPVAFTLRTMELLDAALLYVVKKVIHAAGIGMVGMASSGFTLLDRMAMILHKGIALSSKVGSWTFQLVKKMAAIVGIIVEEGKDLTFSFIRFVFLRLHQKISEFILMIGRNSD